MELGPFKLLHIGEINVNDLCREVNVFTFTGQNSNGENDTSMVEEIADFDDNKEQIVLPLEENMRDQQISNLINRCKETVTENGKKKVTPCEGNLGRWF